MRVASLIASSTEIVCALGLEEALVARSHECDFPPSVAALPAVTRPRLDIHASSAEIDRQVKAIVATALSVYDVDAAALRRVAPEVLLTQTQCEVCAVSVKDVERALCEWLGGEARPRVVALAPDSLADVWKDIARVADALGAPERGRALVDRLQARIAQVQRRVAGLPRPTVALLEWIDPPMAAGNWMPELCDLAGGECVIGEAGKHTPYLRWEELRAKDPEVIVVLPCGFDLARTRAEAKVLEAKPGWRDLRAVRAGRVFLADGNAYFNRPGPRLVESLEALAEMLHPGVSFGHEGSAWARADAGAGG
jgi:iron complex transport system substrate-binding protein